MSYAKWLAVLALPVAAVGCCTPRWPTTQGLAPHQSYIRYLASALREGDKKCAQTNDQEELKRCANVFNSLKPVLIKLEEDGL